MQSFTKKIAGRKGKDSAEIFPSSEYWWTLQWNLIWHWTQNFPDVCKFCSSKLLTPVCLPTCCCLATFPLSDVIPTLFFTVARQHCGYLHIYIYIYIYIYKYIFRSNWRGLAPLGPSARPDKFINLASRGITIKKYFRRKKTLTIWSGCPFFAFCFRLFLSSVTYTKLVMTLIFSSKTANHWSFMDLPLFKSKVFSNSLLYCYCKLVVILEIDF